MSNVRFKSLTDRLKEKRESVSEKLSSLIGHDCKEDAGDLDTEVLFAPGSPSKSSTVSQPQADKGGLLQRLGSFEVIPNEQKEIYELQLSQLQDQLVNSAIENQSLTTELAELKKGEHFSRLDKELAFARKQITELSIKLFAATKQTGSSVNSNVNRSKGEETACAQSAELESPVGCSDSSWYHRLLEYFVTKYWKLVEDFSVTSEDEQPQEPETLAVKKLKKNIARFGAGVRPILETVDGFAMLFNWQQPLLTLITFLMYMYVCVSGLLIPALLFLAVIRLLLNLAVELKLIPDVSMLPRKSLPEPSAEKDTSLSDKFNIVVQVATKVQNQFGNIADGLEKITNLLTWKRPEHTKKIFYPLLAVFLLSTLVSVDLLITIGGVALGIKLFIIDAVYNRFPKVRQHYDGTAQLWKSLMTDEQLQKCNALSAHHQLMLPRPGSGKPLKELDVEDSILETPTDDDKDFCDRFNLPYNEYPLKETEFRSGRGCFHLDATLSLSLPSAMSNHANLFLTRSFLCYEKRNGERRAIPLANITRLAKKKSLSLLPGSGMSLEISVVGFEKPQVFAALLHRDEWYNRIMELGQANNLIYTQSHPECKSEIRLSELGRKDETYLDSGVLGDTDFLN